MARTSNVRPLRVAMIGTRGLPATVGGVERAVEELSARLVAAGHEVTVYCRTSYGPTRDPVYRGIRLRYLPAVNTKHLEAISHSLLATLDAMARRYDIVHFHALGPNLCAPLARVAGLRVVTTVHSLDFRAGKWGRSARLVLRLGALVAAKVPNRTLVVSRGLQKYFASEYGCDATYVPNGADVSASPLQTSAIERLRRGHLLFLGRLVPEKGVHTLIDAYAGIETSVPLVIAGPSSHSGEYERRLRDLARLDPRVALVGPIYGDQKAEIVQSAYVFCQPSTHEGLPIALLEMMGEGICPIVSDISEHLEIVSTDGGRPTAIVFRANDVGSLRDALTRALEHPELVAELGAAARQVVMRRYGWDEAASEVETIYDEVTMA